MSQEYGIITRSIEFQNLKQNQSEITCYDFHTLILFQFRNVIGIVSCILLSWLLQPLVF